MLLLLRAAQVDRLRGQGGEQENQRAAVVVLGGLLDGQRQRFIGRVRGMAKACAETYVASRAKLEFPLLPKHLQKPAVEAYRAAAEAGVNAGALAAARAVAPHAEEIAHAG
ncbi:MAG: hypothetical protein ABI559_09885 [Chloroflexota bacterium]